VIASLLFGFWVIPQLGLISAIAIVTSLLCAIATAALLYSKAKPYAVVAYIGVAAAAIMLPSDKFAQLLVKQEGGELLYFSEGIGNTVAVIEQGEGERQFRRLYIEGISNTGDVMASLRYMRLQSYIPLLVFNGEPKSALVIGMGTGITSGALLNYPTLAKRAVVELLPEVVEATQHFKGNYDIFNQQGLSISTGDGRHQLLRDPQRYDLITLEPPPPTAAGVNNLYSSDFYRLCKTRLTDNGMVAQWWPISTQSLEASRSLVRSMLDNFTYVTLWTTELHEMLLIGSMQPMPVNIDAIKKTMAYPPLAESLKEIGINSPAALLATYMMGNKGLENFAGDARPITDNFPRLEYDRWTSKRVILEILPKLLSQQRQLPEIHGGLKKDYRFEQEKLHAFYYAGLSIYSGDRDTWQEMMKRLYRADSSNAYYNWFRVSD
jgi:spermidine synthase